MQRKMLICVLGGIKPTQDDILRYTLSSLLSERTQHDH